MTTWSAWRESYLKDRTVRPVTWLSGPETILKEEVLEEVRGQISPEPWNVHYFVAGDDPERRIWATLDEHPIDKKKRLVVVRAAQRLKKPHRIQEWLKARAQNPLTFVVFISDDKELPRLPPDPEKKFGKGEVMPFLSFGAKGHLIECKPFTVNTAAKARVWVQERAHVKPEIAGFLLDRANGDLRLVRDICVKLAVFPGQATRGTITQMLREVPGDDFADALIMLDKKTALLALERLAVADYSVTIGFLDSRLELAGMIHDMQAAQATAGEIARAAGNKNFLVKDIAPHAKHYDAKRRLRIRQTLAVADEYLRQGAHEGVLESVVALW